MNINKGKQKEEVIQDEDIFIQTIFHIIIETQQIKNT